MNVTDKFAQKGVLLVPGLFDEFETAQLLTKLPSLQGAAGNRDILRSLWCQNLALDPRLQDLASSVLGDSAEPRRAILFDKSAEVNWVLGYHQDLKIAVQQKEDVDGYTAWSTKNGVTHCQPPESVLRKCLALRIHLDDCPSANGPLRVLEGSHKFGITPTPPTGCHEEVCTALAGDVLMMHPLTWHASTKSQIVSHRRVIHIEYSCAVLPKPLEWAYTNLRNTDF